MLGSLLQTASADNVLPVGVIRIKKRRRGKLTNRLTKKNENKLLSHLIRPPGAVFVQRNVGNLATHKDLNAMSCLEYGKD